MAWSSPAGWRRNRFGGSMKPWEGVSAGMFTAGEAGARVPYLSRATFTASIRSLRLGLLSRGAGLSSTQPVSVRAMTRKERVRVMALLAFVNEAPQGLLTQGGAGGTDGGQFASQSVQSSAGLDAPDGLGAFGSDFRIGVLALHGFELRQRGSGFGIAVGDGAAEVA